MKRVATVVLALTIVAVVVGCGVPSNSQPFVLKKKDVPFDLLAPTASVTSTTQPVSVATANVTIYLVDADGKLVSARREVESPATVARAIQALLGGPTDDETGQLSTAITSDTKLRHVSGPEDGRVTIDLSHQLLDITGRQQILALAQVVFTATSLPGVDRVLFEIDGERREVPNGEGTLTSSPLGRLSYRDLVND